MPLGDVALRLAADLAENGGEQEQIRDLLLRSLWRPTDPSLVSKLPKGNTMLDYLGHADTTRLIAEIDPMWEWWPWPEFAASWGEDVVARDDNGYPRRLYIKLTILGVTRPGIGTVEKGKSDPEKELIGDAIRNAAMRFGIGADLWSKAPHGDLDATAGEHARAAKGGGKDWYIEAGWDGGQAEHDRSRENLLARLRTLNPENVAAFRKWRESAGYKIGNEASTHDEWVAMLDKAKELQAAQKTPDATTPPQSPQEPSAPDAAPTPPSAAGGESGPPPPESAPPPPPSTDEDDEVPCPACLGGPDGRIDPDCWGCDGRGTVKPAAATTATQVLDAREKAPDHPECAFCGSKRTKVAEVNGHLRCVNATDCRRRAEARKDPAEQ
jgi:hypothetical protein